MRCKRPHHWSSSRAEGRRKALCGLLCKQYVERGVEELHHHRERATGIGLCFGQVSCLLGWVGYNHLQISLGLEVPTHQEKCQGKLIRWVLLLQEFNLQIRDKNGVENVVVDHISRLTIAHNNHNPPINDEFPEESLLLVENTPWYAHIANYFATGELPADWKAQDRKFFFEKIHSYYWEEPFLYKYCVDE